MKFLPWILLSAVVVGAVVYFIMRDKKVPIAAQAPTGPKVNLNPGTRVVGTVVEKAPAPAPVTTGPPPGGIGGVGGGVIKL